MPSLVIVELMKYPRKYFQATIDLMANRWENNGNNERLYLFILVLKSLQMVTAAMKLKDAYSFEVKL